MSKFKPVDPKADFPQMEEDVLKFWDDNKIFDKSLQKTAEGKPFVFFEGPPTANAKPAIHHVEARAFKDLIPRYQTMRGRRVTRKAGWDTHGLPVELQVEKALGISGKKQIESIKPTIRESIIEFNRLCKESVWEYKEEWEKLTRRMGFWVDMQNPYITYQNTYIESVWWILKQAWDKDLVYLGHKVVPYCPRCGTALSSHEVAQGYKTVQDTSVFVKFRLKQQPDTHILSWTTTPWTLPGNVALAVGQDIDYVKIKAGNEFWILAKERLSSLRGALPEQDIGDEAISTMKGSELVGLEYEPLFDVAELKSDKSYKIYPADFVTTTDGTGVVHTAVMYGEEDYQLGEQIGLPKFHTVDDAGHFIPSIPDVGEMYVKDKKTENKIFEHLKDKGYFVATEQYEHEYPHCWRCNTPLLYYARDSWFIKMNSLREQLLSNNEQINWVPDYIKHGRFGEWLKDVKDWAISRERYWGTPLPIWQCTDCKNFQMVGSIRELSLTTNTFYFSRHGQAENNVLGISDCWPDTEHYNLTELGKKQVAEAAGNLNQLGIDIIYASDITRDKQTAEIYAQALGLEVIFDERLREVNVGEFKGRPYEEYWKAYSFEERWTKAAKGGETNQQVQDRMADIVSELSHKYENKKILIVSHGDPIWVLMKKFGADTEYPLYAKPFEMNVGIEDLHRPYIDDVVLKCEKCGQDAKRIPVVMDVWFDSGAMPYAQWHYPFENKDMLDGDQGQFPADFISEAIDQTRGWFYTLLAISTMLDRGPAYKNVINLGHLLDEKGQKMSKSKGNVVDPWGVIDTHGVDGLRWYMYSVNQPGDSKLFTVRDVEQAVRKNFLTLWNVLSFFTTYASFDNWEPGQSQEEKNILDFWMHVKTKQLILDITKNLDEFNVFRASRTIETFINEFSTWYVRRSRDRKGPAVYETLYSTLKDLSKLLAPFTPFLAENMWQVLRQDEDPESVHLASWPTAEELSDTEKDLLGQMEQVRQIVESGHSVRKTAGIKLRQPLASVAYFGKTQLPETLEAILSQELNVKAVNYNQSEEFKVEFDTQITPELRKEGLAAELTRAVQDMRKKNGFKVGELVNLTYDTDDGELVEALALLDIKKTYVNEVNQGSGGESLEIEGKKINIKLSN
ncbi:MAG: class I tRNA ligase family protein [Candidatus Doudnabacteria bacterium]|nr:class I tRNA ligase family protein [Candidatus Doudnabacteria bacterium]